MAGALWLLACYRSRASALSIWWLLPQFLKNLKKLPFFYSKRASSPAKTEVSHEKNCLFWLKKTSQPRKKQKFCMTKWQKYRQKSSQKEHPAPQKLKLCKKKKFIFYLKRPPNPAKNSSFAWKNDKKLTKNWPKIPSSPAKTWSFARIIENRPTYGDFERGFWKKIPTPNFTNFLIP